MDKIMIIVKVGEGSVERHYAIIDGQVPENIKENLQEIVESLLDKSEL